MSISMIWAMSRDGLIGKDNGLPWKLPNDMKFFREHTLGKTVVMGRKTWDTFAGKPLPRRRNIVLTTDRSFQADGVEVVHSVEEVLQMAEQEDLMIIGGANVYKQFFSFADQLIVTRIDAEFAGDTYFPDMDWSDFELKEKIAGVKDEKNPYNYYFMFYERRKPIG